MTDASNGAGQAYGDQPKRNQHHRFEYRRHRNGNDEIKQSLEKTITVAATDTLTDVQTKIQSLGWGLAANLVNDSSGGERISPTTLTSTNTGHAGGRGD